MQTVSTNYVFDIPIDVAKCPYCKARLSAQAHEWSKADDGLATVEGFDLECDAEPDVEDQAWNEWWNQHRNMPTVHWLPVQKIVKAYLNQTYRVDLEDA